VVGVAGAPLLAACGGGSDDSPSAGSEPTAGGSSAPAEDRVEVPAGDVPVGGGTILPDSMVVVTQPTEGEFRAFSAVCTHQGCPVQSIRDGVIACPCHGSEFAVEDGTVVKGPATTALESLPVQADGGTVTVG
jgi:Rieske Fe-S protein